MALPVFLDGVKWSVFDQSRSTTTSGKIGKLIPLEAYLLNFGDKFCGKNNHLMRFAPMLSPIYSEMRFDIDTLVVPLRVLYPEGIDKFNLATNPEGWELPTIDVPQKVISKGLADTNLFDYFDMGSRISEIHKAVKSVLTWSRGGYGYLDWSPAFFNEVLRNSSASNALKTTFISFEYEGRTYKQSQKPDPGYTQFIVHAASNWIETGTVNPLSVIFSGKYSEGDLIEVGMTQFLKEFPTFDSWLLAAGYNVNTFYDELSDLMSTIVLDSLFTSGGVSFAEDVFGLSDNMITLPASKVPDWAIRAYNKVFIDYYANTQVIDPDAWEAANVLSTTDANLKLLSRFYGDDYFTQSFPNSQVGDAVMIPADGTMIDLANASAWQRLKLRLGYTGKRIKDFAMNIYGTRVPDARLDRSELLTRVTYRVQVSDVAQTSQSTSSSELASFSGRGISWGKSIKSRYSASEPCVVLVLGSVRPDTYYDLGLDPYFTVRNTVDFPIPDMENVGNHPISKQILSGLGTDADVVFAWNRPYYPFISRNINRVTGNMRTIYRYWTMARDINDMVYNPDWLQVQDDESINQVFTVKNVDHFYLHFHSWASISRPLSKTIKFDI